MKASDIRLNDKALKFLQDNSRFILNAGSTGTGKTFLTGIKTFLRVFNAPQNQSMFAIVAESQTTAEKMFVDDDASFVNLFAPLCDFKGGAKPHIQVSTPTGVKRIYLGGYGTARDWKKILGLNLSGLHIEEISIAHDDFIREAFVRANRKGANGWIHATTNGGIPEQIFYTEFWNKGVFDKDLNQNIPLGEMEAMTFTDANFKYWYWGFEDSVTLSQDDIDYLYSLFPVGSFYYNSKILGVRGYVEGMLYARLINDIYIDKDNQAGNNVRLKDMKLHAIQELIVGVDLGSGSDETAARTSFVLVGFTKDYQRAVVIDRGRVSGDFDYNDIVNEFWEWLRPYFSVFGHRVGEIRIDNADPLFIRTLRNNNVYNISILGSIKDTIALRVALKQQLLLQHRLLFTDQVGAQAVKINLTKIKSDGKDGHYDDNMEWIDDSDALDYALTPRKKALMKGWK